MSKKLTKVTCQNCYGNLAPESEYDAARCPCGAVVAQYRYDDPKPEIEWIAYKGRMLEAVRVGGWRFVKGTDEPISDAPNAPPPPGYTVDKIGIKTCLSCDERYWPFESHSCKSNPDLIQQRALETWYPVDDVDFFKQKNQAALQLASEGGEVAALWAKFNYKPAFKLREGMTREETFKANLLDELGDVLYYLAVLAHLYGWTIEDISQHNYEKLKGGHGWKTPSQ